MTSPLTLALSRAGERELQREVTAPEIVTYRFAFPFPSVALSSAAGPGDFGNHLFEFRGEVGFSLPR